MSRADQIKKLLEKEPDDVFLNYSLAMELAKLGQVDAAVSQFARVVAIDPNYVAAYFQSANALLGASHNEEAVKLLEQGIAVAERTGDTHAAGEMREVLASIPHT